MRRNRTDTTNPSETLKHIAELSKMNFNLLVQLVPYLDANERSQRKFRNVVVASLMKIEASLSLLLVGQQVDRQGRKLWFTHEQLNEDAQVAEEFIAKQVFKRGQDIMAYIHAEQVVPGEPQSRRRGWSGWEI